MDTLCTIWLMTFVVGSLLPFSFGSKGSEPVKSMASNFSVNFCLLLHIYTSLEMLCRLICSMIPSPARTGCIQVFPRLCNQRACCLPVPVGIGVLGCVCPIFSRVFFSRFMRCLSLMFLLTSVNAFLNHMMLLRVEA